MRKFWIAAGLVVIIGASLILSYFSLTNGDWWGDFAGYFTQAKAILAGDPARAVDFLSAINARSPHPPGPNAYPWGYPLMVAAVAAKFGFSPVPIKLINVSFYALFLLILFFFARRKTPAIIAAAITAMFAFSPISLSLIDHLRSDVVFMAFSLGAVLLFDLIQTRPNRWAWLGLGGLIFLAYSSRTVGVLLLALPFTYVLFSPKSARLGRLKNVGWALGGFGVLTVIYRLALPGGEGSYFTHLDPFSISGLWKSLAVNFVIPRMLVSPLPGAWIWYFMLLIAFVVAVWRGWREELAILLYLGAMVGVLVLWPEPQGYRFYAPILPIAVVYAARGALAIGQGKAKVFGYHWNEIAVLGFIGLFLGFTVPMVVSTARLTMSKDRLISGPFDQQSAALFRKIDKLVPEDAWIEFAKPRSIVFFTDRLAYDVGRCEDLDPSGYVLFSDLLEAQIRFDEAAFLACPGIKRELIYENSRYQLYEYNGE